MQLIVARWQITIEQRAHQSHKTTSDADRLERRVAHLRQLEAADRRRDWARDWLTMHGDPYNRPRD